ncbi:hypothetical protein HDU88_007304 [Geranomyces variabilis]|nr:hypothetical protein HDU88_007304 [Geranomyces variabilis]
MVRRAAKPIPEAKTGKANTEDKLKTARETVGLAAIHAGGKSLHEATTGFAKQAHVKDTNDVLPSIFAKMKDSCKELVQWEQLK